MAKTVHVLPVDKGWTVKREGHKADGVYQTQREAIQTARRIARRGASGQVAVHARDGRIREHHTYGMPRVQDPPGKKSERIDKAVGKVTRERLNGDAVPLCG